MSYKLIVERWNRFVNESTYDMAKAIEYTAFVLDEESHNKLASLAPEGWEVLAHHMTIIPPTKQQSEPRLPERYFFEGELQIVGIAQNEMVMAGRVDSSTEMIPVKIEGLPHVTIAINKAKGGKAMMSNEFTEADFKPLDQPIVIRGKVEEIPRGASAKTK
jgi:hypothetical protein